MKHSRYEILINDKVWSFYPKSRDGLLNAIDELELAMGESKVTGNSDNETFRLVYSVYDADKGAIVDPAHPAKLLQRYDVYDVEWGDVEQNGYDQSMDESMDGDFDSGMASAGLGTDEDYGCFGEDETYGNDF